MQKDVEDASKIHVGAGYVQAYEWNFNRPGSGLNTFHSLDPDHNNGAPVFGQVWANRPSEGWVPGFVVSLDWGRGAKRSKADWDGDVLTPLGVDDVSKQIAVAVIDRDATLIGVYQGDDPASHAVELLEKTKTAV